MGSSSSDPPPSDEAKASGLKHEDKWNHKDWPTFRDGNRHAHAAVALDDGTIIIMGGNEKFTVEVWSPKTDSEAKYGASLRKIRHGVAGVVCNDKMYAIGGYGDGTPLNSMECIDVDDIRTTAARGERVHCKLSTARQHCAAVPVLDRYILVAGGKDDSGCLDTVDIYDTETNSITEGPSMKTPRFQFGAAVVGNRVFVVGGSDGDAQLDSVECIEFLQNPEGDDIFTDESEWIEIPTLTLEHARKGHSVVAKEQCLVVAGGMDADGDALKSVEVVDTERLVVWSMPDMKKARRNCAAVALPDGRVAVLGGYGLNSAESLKINKRDGLDPYFKELVAINTQHKSMVPKIYKLCALLTEVPHHQALEKYLTRLVETETVSVDDYKHIILMLVLKKISG